MKKGNKRAKREAKLAEPSRKPIEEKLLLKKLFELFNEITSPPAPSIQGKEKGIRREG